MKRKAYYKRIFRLAIIIIISVGLYDVYAQANEQRERQIKITKYEIKVTIPYTYDRIDVCASLDIKILYPEHRDDLNIILCKDFIGVNPVHVRMKNGDGTALDFTQDGDVFRIKLPNRFYKEKAGRVQMEYSLVKDEEYEKDMYSSFAFEVSDTLSHINAAITRTDNWYPKIEGTMHDRLPEFILSVDVPSKFEVMASGKLNHVKDKNNRKIFEWHNYPEITDRSLYFFIAEQERIVKTFSDGFKVIMYVPDNTSEDNLRYISDVIHKSFRFFESKFGKVPGDEYKIMAFPYAYSGLYRSMTAPVSLFTSKIVNNDIYYPTRTIIHEISHTWWGNVVSANAEEEYWLFEGFAKYSEVIGIKPAVGADVETLSFFRLKLSTLPYLDYLPSIKDAGREEERYLQTVAAYYQGATLLKMLESIMGKEKFYLTLRDYTNTFRRKCIQTDDFLHIIEKHSSKDIRDLVYDHLHGSGYATYSIMRIDLERHEDGYPHLFLIQNTGDKDLFTDVRTMSDLQDTTRIQLVRKKQLTDITIKSRKASGPVSLIVDPKGIYPVCESGMRSPGGMVFRNVNGDVVFFNIVPNSILENAGIQNNMKLINVNGDDLKEKDLKEMNTIFLKPPDTRLKCLVEDQGGNSSIITIYY